MKTKPKIIIRDAQLKDVEIMAKIGSEARELWSGEGNGWYSKHDLKEWLKNKGNDVLLVAEAGEGLVGFIVLHNLITWAFCTGLYVHPRYRKRGIGTSLLSEVEKRLKKQNILSLHLLVEQEDLPAMCFYEKNQFKKGFHFIWMKKEL